MSWIFPGTVPRASSTLTSERKTAPWASRLTSGRTSSANVCETCTTSRRRTSGRRRRGPPGRTPGSAKAAARRTGAIIRRFAGTVKIWNLTIESTSSRYQCFQDRWNPKTRAEESTHLLLLPSTVQGTAGGGETETEAQYSTQRGVRGWAGRASTKIQRQVAVQRGSQREADPQTRAAHLLGRLRREGPAGFSFTPAGTGGLQEGTTGSAGHQETGEQGEQTEFGSEYK